MPAKNGDGRSGELQLDEPGTTYALCRMPPIDHCRGIAQKGILAYGPVLSSIGIGESSGLQNDSTGKFKPACRVTSSWIFALTIFRSVGAPMPAVRLLRGFVNGFVFTFLAFVFRAISPSTWRIATTQNCRQIPRSTICRRARFETFSRAKVRDRTGTG